MTNKMQATSERMTAITNILSTPGSLRVWSVIVTIFGDLALRRGDQISGQTLSRLTGAVGIKPEAARVALFRLKKDGWITSNKLGRQSLYRLSDRAFDETEVARPRIYGPCTTEPTRWRLCLAPPHANADETGMMRLSAGVFLNRSTSYTPPDGWFCVDGNASQVPDWLRMNLVPEDLGDVLALLEISLAQVVPLVQKQQGFQPLEVAVLRLLIVHHWRRIVLRLPDLPDRFFPCDWPLGPCRNHVKTLLEQLPRPSLNDI